MGSPANENFVGLLEVLAKPSTTDFCGRYIGLPFIHAASTKFSYSYHHHQGDEEGSLYSSYFVDNEEDLLEEN